MNTKDPQYQYVIIAYRGGVQAKHQYIVGCNMSLDRAKQVAKDENAYRGGKYAVAVWKVPVVKRHSDVENGDEFGVIVHYEKANWWNTSDTLEENL